MHCIRLLHLSSSSGTNNYGNNDITLAIRPLAVLILLVAVLVVVLVMIALTEPIGFLLNLILIRNVIQTVVLASNWDKVVVIPLSYCDCIFSGTPKREFAVVKTLLTCRSYKAFCFCFATFKNMLLVAV